MKKLLIFSVLIFTTTINAQIIDNYGIRMGVGISNQEWQYKHWSNTIFSETKNTKVGFSLLLNTEKNITDYLSIRPEIGYIQKGFRVNLTNGEALHSLGPHCFDLNFVKRDINENIVLHNLALNISIKLSPLKTKIKPFLVVGVRGGYLINYKDIYKTEKGEKGLYGNVLELYNKFLLSAIIALGVDYNDKMQLEFEYNPAITKNFDDGSLSITDNYFGITVGANINKFLKN